MHREKDSFRKRKKNWNRRGAQNSYFMRLTKLRGAEVQKHCVTEGKRLREYMGDFQHRVPQNEKLDRNTSALRNVRMKL